jgi:cobalt/nickel transport system permease protein
LHHVVLERWSRGDSVIHRRDPRAKIAALIVLLAVLATSHRGFPLLAAGLMFALCCGIVSARLPLVRVLARAAVVLLFTAVLALSAWLGGDPFRAFALVVKSYLSALAVLLVVATTPMPDLLRGLETSGVPRFLLMVTQFLYRYLFVISEEAQHMRVAAAARGGSRFVSAAGTLAGLFTRSYARAEDIHRAMLARGFTGHFRALHTLRFRTSDTIFAVGGSLVSIVLRAAAEKLT